MSKFEKLLKQCPPFFVRVCARKGRRSAQTRITRLEIISASGLDGRTIDKLSRARSWDAFTIRVIIAYTNACGVDLADLAIHKKWFKHCKHVHWKSHPELYAKFLSR